MAKYFDVQKALQDGGDPKQIQSFMIQNKLQPLPQGSGNTPPPPQQSAQAQPQALTPPPSQPQVTQSGGINNVDPNSVGSLENGIGNTGLFDIPLLGGVLRGVSHPALKGLEFAGQGASEGLTALLGGQKAPQVASNNAMAQVGDTYNRSAAGALDQWARNTLGVASYAVPFGKAGFIGSKAIIPGAVAGGLIGASQDQAKLPDIAKSVAIGAAMAGTMQGLGWLYGKTQGNLANGANSAEEDITNPDIKPTGNYAQDKADALAVKQKYMSGMNADESLKEIPSAQAKAAGDIQDILKPLTKPEDALDKSAISKAFTDDFSQNSSYTAEDPQFVSAYKDLTKRLDTLGDNPTPTQIYDFKQELSPLANKANDLAAKGSPISAKQEAAQAMWGALKESLDNVSPEVRQLNREQYILGSVLPKGLVQSAEKSGPSLPIPGTLKGVPLPISNNLMQNAKLGLGGSIAAVGNKLPQGLPQILPQAAAMTGAAMTDGNLNQPAQPQLQTQPSSSVGGDQTNKANSSSKSDQLPSITGYSPQQLGQAYVKATQAGDAKAADKIKTMYDMETAYQTQQKQQAAQPLPAAQQLRHDNITTALTSLDTAEQNLVTSGGAKGALGYASTLPVIGQYTNPKGTAYQNTKIETATNIAKAITGGSRVPEKVINAYLESLPSVSDTPEYAQQKLNMLRTALLNQAKSAKFDDIAQMYQ